jgi:hypothetical protein
VMAISHFAVLVSLLVALLHSCDAFTQITVGKLDSKFNVRFELGLRAFGRALRPRASKQIITAELNRNAMDRRQLLIGAVATSFLSSTRKAAAITPEKQFSQALLELSNQVPYEDKAVAFLSDGSPLFKAAQAALTNLGGTVVLIDPKKPVKEIQQQYKKGNCVAAFVPSPEIVKAIMAGRGCECEK